MIGSAGPNAVHVDLRRITQRFQSGGGTDLLALDQVDLQARRGEFVSIVGPSGCGKSTLLYIVAGLLKASEGEVLVDGRPIRGPDPDRGLVLQNSSIFPWRTVEENIAFGPQMSGMAQANAVTSSRAISTWSVFRNLPASIRASSRAA